MERGVDYIVGEDERGSATVATCCKLGRGSVTALLYWVWVSAMVLMLRLAHVSFHRLVR